MVFLGFFYLNFAEMKRARNFHNYGILYRFVPTELIRLLATISLIKPPPQTLRWQNIVDFVVVRLFSLIPHSWLRCILYFFEASPDDTEASVEADDRCNRFEARSCGRLEAALASTSAFCFVGSMSSIDRLRPTRIVLPLLLLLFPLFRRLDFSCLRGDANVLFLLRAFFRVLVVERFDAMEFVEEVEEERFKDEDDATRLIFGILRGNISLFPSSSLSSSPDSYKMLSNDSLRVSFCMASKGVVFRLLLFSPRNKSSLCMALPTTIALFASSKPSLYLFIASNISLSVGLQSGPFPRLSSLSRARVALSLEYPHRLIRASIPFRTAAANSVLARISSETLSRDGIFVVVAMESF